MSLYVILFLYKRASLRLKPALFDEYCFFSIRLWGFLNIVNIVAAPELLTVSHTLPQRMELTSCHGIVDV